MGLHLLVDGYNLIRQSPSLQAEDEIAPELGREALLERLRQYKRVKGHQITVVFDAAQKPTVARQRTRDKGIRIIYSGRGESADSVIKAMCRSGGEKLVVTSDRELMNHAEACGAIVVDSKEFEEKMQMALYLESKGAEEENELEKDRGGAGTRKKGPARRAPKKERRRRQRKKKL